MLHIIKSDQCLSDIIKHIKQLITRLECDQYYWSEGDEHYWEVQMPWSNANIKIYLILVIRNMNIWDQCVSDINCLSESDLFNASFKWPTHTDSLHYFTRQISKNQTYSG